MPGPSVRWRHDGTLLLDDDDTLLRFHVAVPQADGVAAAPLVPLDLLEAGDPRAVESARQLFARIVETHRAR